MLYVTRPQPAGDETAPVPGSAGRRGAATVGVVGLALAAALGAGLVLPQAAYTAGAVVGVEGGPPSLRPALIQAAADAARPRHVRARAAAPLPAKLATRPEALAAGLQVDAGRVPGTLVLRVADGDAERAAALASALAGALVAELEDRTQATRRDDDAADAMRLAALQAAAAEAHRKLSALGGDAPDPAVARAGGTSRAEALRARLDAIRSILAAGNPPLGAGRDVPPNIDALQTGYLDLTRQLAKARETLGERHTTVVGLQESIRRSAAELTAAWTRLAKAAEQEIGEARAVVAKTGFDAGRLAALDAARAAARVADDAAARAASPRDGDDEPRWHLVARASAPALADGLGLPLRLALAAAAGLFVLLMGLRSLRRPRQDNVLAVDVAEPAPPMAAVKPTFFDDELPETPELLPQPGRLEPVLDARDDAPLRAPSPLSAPSHDEMELEDLFEAVSEAHPTGAAADLAAAVAPALTAIDALPCGGLPIVLMVADEAGVDTTEPALALGAAAAAKGRRVLIVEGRRARPALAGAVDPEAEPALADVLGATCIVLRAEAGAGLIYLAPVFADGARLAADLARAGTALVADDLADEFDLVVVDGGRAMDAAALAEGADGVLRIGRFGSPRDGARLMASLGAPRAAFLGTFATLVSEFVRAPAPPRPAPSRPATPAPRAPLGPHPLRRPAPAEARRRVGAR